MAHIVGSKEKICSLELCFKIKDTFYGGGVGIGEEGGSLRIELEDDVLASLENLKIFINNAISLYKELEKNNA